MTLVTQIVDQLNAEFKKRKDEYKDTLIKEIYKPFPKGLYPKIIVQEIGNREVISRSTTEGERTTSLGYQITCYSRDMQEKDYLDSVRFMMDIVDEFIEKNYKMRRLGDRAIKPYIKDNTIMTCTQRYSCVYDKDTNLIYKN